eukprot:16227371-Heterocapsa_arctica.AAC.1
MADSKLESEFAMDLLGSLDLFEGETKKDKNKKRKAAFKERTTDMATIPERAGLPQQGGEGMQEPTRMPD